MAVLANVTLPVPCYTAEYHITEDLNGDFHIGLELTPESGDCIQVVVDKTYQISISPTCLNHTIEVYILGDLAGLELTTSCVLKGDLNGNDIAYEIGDYMRILGCCVGYFEQSEREKECWTTLADLNLDGRVNLVDIIWMIQIISGDRQPPI